jgi:hypothetical protein
MAKKKRTFADEAKNIKNRYYSNRKPGEDSITDDAFEGEMQALMQKQEAVKPPESQANQGPTHTMPDGTVMLGATHEEQFAKGGNLPKYDGFSTSTNYLNRQSSGLFNPIESNNYELNQLNQTPIDFNNQKSNGFQNIGLDQEQIIPDEADTYAAFPGLDFSKNRQTDIINRDAPISGENKSFSPTANILGPALSIGTSAISSAILSRNAKKRKEDLLKNIGSSKIQAQQVDLSRDRANIRSNQALTEATGREVSKGAASASEAAAIQNQARLSGQRVGGNQLSQSLQRESIENARLRGEADRFNVNLGRQDANQRLTIERQYGDVPAQLGADFARTTGQSIGNYISENQQMRDFYNQANMLNPNFELDFQEEFNKLTPRQQRLRRLGIGSVSPRKRITNA